MSMHISNLTSESSKNETANRRGDIYSRFNSSRFKANSFAGSNLIWTRSEPDLQWFVWSKVHPQMHSKIFFVDRQIYLSIWKQFHYSESVLKPKWNRYIRLKLYTWAKWTRQISGRRTHHCLSKIGSPVVLLPLIFVLGQKNGCRRRSGHNETFLPMAYMRYAQTSHSGYW